MTAERSAKSALAALAATQAKLDALTERRDHLLALALDAGAPSRTVAAAAGLTHPTVIARARAHRTTGD